MRKRGFTAVELVLVIVVLAIVVSVTLVQVDKRRQARLRAESAENLRTLFRNITTPFDAKPFQPIPLPVLSVVPGQLAPQLASDDKLMKYLHSGETNSPFISPAHPEADRMRKAARANPTSSITDDSYWYFGYLLTDEETGLAFVDAYRKAVENTGKPLTHDKIGVRPYGGERLDLPLTPSQWPDHSIPLFIERPGLQRGGSTVLWSDGVVRFMEYPGPWPMTEKFIKALESLDELKVKE